MTAAQGYYISSSIMAVQFAALLAILLFGIRLKRVHPVTRLLYLMWIAVLFTSNLYYLAHALQDKGLYLPFSAMDIVDTGIYTLLPAALQNNFSISLKKMTPAGTVGALFGAVNIWLWILWSGSWLGNMINALPFVYLMFICVRSLEESGAFSWGEWLCYLIASVTVAVMESVLYFVSGTSYMVLDITCYISLFTCTLYLIFKTVDTLQHGTADAALALSASSYAMSAVTIYLSYEPIYFVAEILVIASIILTALAVSRKEKEEAA